MLSIDDHAEPRVGVIKGGCNSSGFRAANGRMALKGCEKACEAYISAVFVSA